MSCKKLSASDILALACHSLGWQQAPESACDAASSYDLAHPQGTWQPGLCGRPLLVYDSPHSPLAENLRHACGVPIFLGSDAQVLPEHKGTAPVALAPEGTLLKNYSRSFMPTTGWIPETSRGRTVVWGPTLGSIMEVVDMLRGYGLTNQSDLTLSPPCHLAQFVTVPSPLGQAHTFAPTESYLCSLTGSCTHTKLPWTVLDVVVGVHNANLEQQGGPLLTLGNHSGVGSIGVIAPAGGDALAARAAAAIKEHFAVPSTPSNPQ